jgi:hypothetical protein
MKDMEDKILKQEREIKADFYKMEADLQANPKP